MAIDISRFHTTFFEESLEGLELMESGLLELEVGSGNTEAINTIFRAAHSIKGGAGTFGFTAITELTHALETILDRRRSGRAEMTQHTIDVLLDSVDCLRDLLAATRDGHTTDGALTADLRARLQTLVDSDPLADPETGAPTPAAPADTTAPGRTWRITFRPLPHIFRTGNDPLRILGELADLGRYQVRADATALPDLEDLDIETCYCRWEIELETSADLTAIEATFEWVDGDAEIAITPLTPDSATANSAPAADTTVTDTTVTDTTVTDTTVTDTTADTTADADTTAGAPNGVGPSAAAERRQGGERRLGEPGPAQTTSIRVDIEKIDTLINMVGELVITQSMLQQIASGGHVDLDKFREGLADLERNTRELQSSVMQVRMLPISFAFSRLPRLVRDLSSKLGKQVELKIQGETTELDKTVMEKIGDPLVHLIRNSLDHGLETPDARRAAGKAETGRIDLAAYHEGGNIVIEISDDGAGLNSARILAKARDRGLVSGDDQLTDRQIHDLIFHPGLSTAETVSDISGRGVGMDVVKRNINDLGGIIEVHSIPGSGATFRIRLPLTLAILDGQVVRVGDQVLVIPLVSIVESLQFDPALMGSIVGGGAIYRHRGEAIPIVHLSETFRLRPPGEATTAPLIVIVETDTTRAGILVDDLLAQQQIVIKSLKSNFRAVPGVSGATILGDGTVAMILDVNSALNLYRHHTPAHQQAA